MTTLELLETKHNFTFPTLFKTLFEADILDWTRGFEIPLEEGKSWAADIYPTLKAKPPLFLHSGGLDFELLSPKEILNFTFPSEWDTNTHHFIPFAKDAEGNYYAFYNTVKVQEETPIVFIWKDDEAEYIAKNYEDFIFSKMMESSNKIDKDDLHADYGQDNPLELYRTDLKADLESIRPYLKEEYTAIIEETYNAEAVETLIAYGFEMTTDISDMLDFELMGEVFEHEL